MEKLNRDICEYELLKQDIVFIDGLTRVGKAMFNTIVASLERISHPQFLEPLEQLLPMYKTGHIDRNAISAFMRLHLNERTYNYALSRNVNFRYDDLTSIHNSTQHKDFFKNLSKKDGSHIIEDLKTDNIIHQFQTHDVLTHYSLFLDLGINVQIIEVLRNPVDTIHSWYKRGWGKRFDNEDPRSFTSLFKYNDKTIPHYAIGYEDIYLTLNEMEKCVFLHNLLLGKSLDEYNKLASEQKKNILIVKYESMLENDKVELDNICKFLKVKKTDFTDKALTDARVPRAMNIEDRKVKLKNIKEKVSETLFSGLKSLEQEYETNLYGLEK